MGFGDLESGELELSEIDPNHREWKLVLIITNN